MNKESIGACRDCPGREVPRSVCRNVMQTVWLSRIIEKAEGNRTDSALPERFCGDREIRGKPQAKEVSPIFKDESVGRSSRHISQSEEIAVREANGEPATETEHSPAELEWLEQLKDFLGQIPSGLSLEERLTHLKDLGLRDYPVEPSLWDEFYS